VVFGSGFRGLLALDASAAVAPMPTAPFKLHQGFTIVIALIYIKGLQL